MQAESDHHVKDTYNYVTIQTDIKMPQRQTRMLHDSKRCQPFQDATRIAVARLKAEYKDVRVLHLGSGAGAQSSPCPHGCNAAATQNTKASPG